MRREELFGLPLDPLPDLETALQRIGQGLAGPAGLLVTFVNPHAWRLAGSVPEHGQALARFDLVLPDGIGVVKALRWVKGIRAARLSLDASSLYLPIFDLLSRERRRLFVIGAAPGVAERALARMRAEFPGIVPVGCLDGYRPAGMAIPRILEARPEIVLCGMGAPRQERFLLALREAGLTGVGLTCGGFLDQLAQKARYYPAWIDRADLRWAWRLAHEPRRLLRRYTLDYAPFIALTALAVVREHLGVVRRAQPEG
jgi:exopolysaccharide biosynthesis WecB/TagA/CpsF family protein